MKILFLINFKSHYIMIVYGGLETIRKIKSGNFLRWTIHGSNPCSDKRFITPSKHPTVSGAHPTSYSAGTGVPSQD